MDIFIRWFFGHQDLKGYHSLYDGKSRRIDQTFSRGASMVIDDETENTPLDVSGGKMEDGMDRAVWWYKGVVVDPFI